MLRCVVVVVCRKAVERNVAIVAVLPVRPRMTISPPCIRHPCRAPRHVRRFVGSGLPFDAVEKKGAQPAKAGLSIIFLFLGSRPWTIGWDGLASALDHPVNRRKDRPVTWRFSRSFCGETGAAFLHRHSAAAQSRWLISRRWSFHNRDDTVSRVHCWDLVRMRLAFAGCAFQTTAQ